MTLSRSSEQLQAVGIRDENLADTPNKVSIGCELSTGEERLQPIYYAIELCD